MISKEEFNNLGILEQLDYVNSQLREGKSIRKLSAEMGMGKSTITDRFRRHNIAYNMYLKQYVEGHTSLLEPVEPIRNTNISLIPEDSLDDLKNILENSSVLLEMIQLFKKNSHILENTIKLDLPESESKLTSVRLNKQVLDDFDIFAEKHKEFKKADLMSMALKYYMDSFS